MTEPAESIVSRILALRAQRVMLDHDLAALYGVRTKVLLQAMRRNQERFPVDFCFQLTKQEVADLRSQIVTSSWGGRRYLPVAFTEHGAIMAATVLNSSRAIQVSLHVVRAFVTLRETVAAHREIGRRVDQLERKVGTHDRAIVEILQAIRQLATPPSPAKRRIGFL